MSKFSKKFSSRSPFKDAPEESHQGYEQAKKLGKTHTHFKDDNGRWNESKYGFDMEGKYEEREPISQEEAEKLTSSGDPRHAALLEGINKNRREEGLPEFKTLEEALR